LKSSGNYGEQHGYTLPEARFTTGNVGVKENPEAPPEKKERQTVEAPRVSNQHF
jgi:hypothetical protein